MDAADRELVELHTGGVRKAVDMGLGTGDDGGAGSRSRPLIVVADFAMGGCGRWL
jgi:hypothetical protein